MNTLDQYIMLRVSNQLRTEFMEKAARYGKPSEVHREILTAFINDRLVIQPDLSKESLYVTRTEN